MQSRAWLFLLGAILVSSGVGARIWWSVPLWEQANPLKELPVVPLGLGRSFAELENPPTPERVRLGRWLFYDKRLSQDGSVSCGTCHQPEFAFSEPTAVSTGIGGQQGTRKAPTFINQAWPIFPHFFWDGRASSLEEQAVGPMINPVEMGNTKENMLATLEKIPGYAPYFAQAFGDPQITVERVAHALADYERTRMSGNSAWDRWQAGDESAVAQEVKRGHELFFGAARCNQCHLGPALTDGRFHNIGVGWDEEKQEFDDLGRFLVTGKDEERGAFKTPTLRDVSLRAPYMHDGSMKTLEQTVLHYHLGGIANPWLSPKIGVIEMRYQDVQDLVAFMKALEGEGYQDQAPEHFPE